MHFKPSIGCCLLTDVGWGFVMQSGTLKDLTLVVAIFFFTSNLSGSFLPVYFKETGLGVPEIAEVLLITFILIGLLPLALLKSVKNFERIISLGIFCTMLFYIVLIYIRSPVILGLAYGLSVATFWPSFNLLQFRLSESKLRARTISFFSIIIPSIASIAGPAVGGFIIEDFSFSTLFAVAVILYFAAFLFSTRIRSQPETSKFSIPRSRIFFVFFGSFIILGLSEAYWIAYPFFVLSISGTVLSMGLVLASSAVLISAMTFVINWVSDTTKMRVDLALVGTALSIVWYFAIASASTIHEIVVLSLLSGLANAFSISWFAHFSDFFGREQYASILVLMEVGLMIGRILNLVPTLVFIPTAEYASHFRLLGLVLFFMIPLYVISRKHTT